MAYTVEKVSGNQVKIAFEMLPNSSMLRFRRPI